MEHELSFLGTKRPLETQFIGLSLEATMMRRVALFAARQAPVISRGAALVPCRRLPIVAAPLGLRVIVTHVNQLRVSTPLCRSLSLSAAELDKKMGEVNDLFVEARELIADALDSQGSTYFEDDLDVRFDVVGKADSVDATELVCAVGVCIL